MSSHFEAGLGSGHLKSPKGGAGLRPAKPKKKDTTQVVSSFLACVDEKDVEIQKQGRPQGGKPNRSPAKRVRFGEEERRNEGAMTFIKKVVANDMQSATTWNIATL